MHKYQWKPHLMRSNNACNFQRPESVYKTNRQANFGQMDYKSCRKMQNETERFTPKQPKWSKVHHQRYNTDMPHPKRIHTEREESLVAPLRYEKPRAIPPHQCTGTFQQPGFRYANQVSDQQCLTPYPRSNTTGIFEVQGLDLMQCGVSSVPMNYVTSEVESRHNRQAQANYKATEAHITTDRLQTSHMEETGSTRPVFRESDNVTANKWTAWDLSSPDPYNTRSRIASPGTRKQNLQQMINGDEQFLQMAKYVSNADICEAENTTVKNSKETFGVPSLKEVEIPSVVDFGKSNQPLLPVTKFFPSTSCTFQTVPEVADLRKQKPESARVQKPLDANSRIAVSEVTKFSKWNYGQTESSMPGDLSTRTRLFHNADGRTNYEVPCDLVGKESSMQHVTRKTSGFPENFGEQIKKTVQGAQMDSSFHSFEKRAAQMKTTCHIEKSVSDWSSRRLQVQEVNDMERMPPMLPPPPPPPHLLPCPASKRIDNDSEVPTVGSYSAGAGSESINIFGMRADGAVVLLSRRIKSSITNHPSAQPAPLVPYLTVKPGSAVTPLYNHLGRKSLLDRWKSFTEENSAKGLPSEVQRNETNCTPRRQSVLENTSFETHDKREQRETLNEKSDLETRFIGVTKSSKRKESEIIRGSETVHKTILNAEPNHSSKDSQTRGREKESNAGESKSHQEEVKIVEEDSTKEKNESKATKAFDRVETLLRKGNSASPKGYQRGKIVKPLAPKLSKKVDIKSTVDLLKTQMPDSDSKQSAQSDKIDYSKPREEKEKKSLIEQLKAQFLDKLKCVQNLNQKGIIENCAAGDSETRFGSSEEETDNICSIYDCNIPLKKRRIEKRSFIDSLCSMETLYRCDVGDACEEDNTPLDNNPEKGSKDAGKGDSVLYCVQIKEEITDDNLANLKIHQQQTPEKPKKIKQEPGVGSDTFNPKITNVYSLNSKSPKQENTNDVLNATMHNDSLGTCKKKKGKCSNAKEKKQEEKMLRHTSLQVEQLLNKSLKKTEKFERYLERSTTKVKGKRKRPKE